MRHGKKNNHLGRTASHRKALLSNMASSLILEKRISTTLAKAKELRKYVEPLLTKSKSDSTHSRRTVFSYLQNKESVKTLFDEVAIRVAGRPGGYTRIIRTGNRLGDNAEMCMMELVDYNSMYTQEKGKLASEKKKTRRSKRSSSTASKTEENKEVKPTLEAKSIKTEVLAKKTDEEAVEKKTEDSKEATKSNDESAPSSEKE